MADQTQTIRIVIDARQAKDGGEDARKSLKAVEDQTTRTATSMDKIEKKIGDVAGKLKAFAVAAAVAWAGSFAHESLAAAAGLDEMAEQLGITTKGLQGLQFAAVQNGIKLEQLETGVSKFSQKIGEAAGGSKEMIEALDGIGVKILDTTGKLRPTEALMSDVARAILSIEDPAKRSAASVDFFGKTGTKFLPTLKEMADGFDVMGNKAAKAGAMISGETIEKLDKLADAGDRSKLSMRALFAENAAGPLTDALDFINRKVANLSTVLKSAKGDLLSLLQYQLNPTLLVGKMLAPTPGEAAQSGLNASNAKIKTLQDEKATFTDPTVTAEYDRLIAKERQNGGTYQAQLWKLQAKDDKANAALNIGDPDNIGISVTTHTGASNPGVKGAGDDVRKRLAKLDQDSARDLAQAQAVADAANQGSAAVAALETHFKALKAAQDAYGDTAKGNAAAVDALTAKIEAQYAATEKLKNLAAFRQGTQDIEQENQLLEAELRLADALPDVRARELAVLKTIQEVQKRGLGDQQADIDRRTKAVEQQELLKQKIEETKKAEELWTAPIKSALSNLQGSLADFFDNLLQGGINSFSDLASAVKNIWRRMVAELLAMSVMRPMMAPLVEAGTSMGLLSPGMAGQLGYSSTGGIGSVGGVSGSSGGGLGGFGGLTSFGGSGGWFSSFLNSTPFASTAAGSVTANGFSSGGAYDSIGDLLSSGAAGQAGGAATLSGLTAGQMLGGIGSIAGIGMGAMTLMNGKGSTGSMVSGISGIIGGGLGLMSLALPALAGTLGPIGLGIGLVGGLLGGLLGGDSPKIPPAQMPDIVSGVLQGNGSGFNYSGDGSSPLTGGAKQIGSSILSLFRQGDLTPVAGKLWGGVLQSGVSHNNWTGQGWSNEAYTQTGILDPNGNQTFTSYNDSSRNLQQAADFLLTRIFKANVMNGGVTGASGTLKSALNNIDPQTASDLQSVIQLSQAYDHLGKAANPVKDAIDKLSHSFDSLADFAGNAGVSLDPINAEIAKQTKRTAQDFIDNMLDPLAVQMRSLADEKDAALASAQYIKDNIAGVTVDLDRISDYYTTKQSQILDQFYGGAIESLQAAIARLTPGGDLSNLDPSSQLSGIKASYNAALAQAQAGDQNAIANIGGLGSNYADAARTFFAGSPAYNAIRDQIISDLQGIQAAIQLPAGSGGSPLDVNNPAISQLTAQVQQLLAVVQQQAADKADLQQQLSQVIGLLNRYLANGQRAA